MNGIQEPFGFCSSSGQGRRWSLWEMQNFYFGYAYFVLGQITMLISLSHRNMRYVAATRARSSATP